MKRVSRSFLLLVLTLLASLGIAPLARGQAGQPQVPVNISLNLVTAISANDVWAVGNGTDRTIRTILTLLSNTGMAANGRSFLVSERSRMRKS